MAVSIIKTILLAPAVFIWPVIALQFSNVTHNVNLLDLSGQIAAFSDFNGDKATDILVLNSTGSVQSMYLWDEKQGQFTSLPLKLDIPSYVVAVRVGDFDGDGLVDFLSLSPDDDDKSSCFSATVHWTTLINGRPAISNSSFLTDTTSSSLLMTFDVDGDHISDILTTSCNTHNTLIIWRSQGKKRTFSPHRLSVDGANSAYLAGYYLDLGSDCIPELLILKQRGRERLLDVWKRKKEGILWDSHISLSFGEAVATSPLTFVDMDGNGVSEGVLLICHRMNVSRQLCTNTSIHIFFQKQFPGSDVLECKGNDSWRLEFVKNESINLTHEFSVPLEVINRTHPHLGDLDLDRYPDLILPVVNASSNSSHAHLLLLKGSGDGTLSPQWNSLNDFPPIKATALSLFDLWEDGIPDVLVSTNEGDNRAGVSAFRQSLSADHTFLKVLVLSGCSTNCASRKIPYGSVLAAASVSYSTTDRNNQNQHTKAITQPSSDPLQLPFVILGLGETPNFIEELTIGVMMQGGSVAGGNDTSIQVGFHKWRNLVPNSQVVVIPPPKPGGRWWIELYLTPSHLMFTTAGILCAVAITMAFIIALLQAREKYQDHQERKQAKHKFHFNAM